MQPETQIKKLRLTELIWRNEANWELLSQIKINPGSIGFTGESSLRENFLSDYIEIYSD